MEFSNSATEVYDDSKKPNLLLKLWIYTRVDFKVFIIQVFTFSATLDTPYDMSKPDAPQPTTNTELPLKGSASL